MEHGAPPRAKRRCKNPLSQIFSVKQFLNNNVLYSYLKKILQTPSSKPRVPSSPAHSAHDSSDGQRSLADQLSKVSAELAMAADHMRNAELAKAQILAQDAAAAANFAPFPQPSWIHRPHVGHDGPSGKNFGFHHHHAAGPNSTPHHAPHHHHHHHQRDAPPPPPPGHYYPPPQGHNNIIYHGGGEQHPLSHYASGAPPREQHPLSHYASGAPPPGMIHHHAGPHLHHHMGTRPGEYIMEHGRPQYHQEPIRIMAHGHPPYPEHEHAPKYQYYDWSPADPRAADPRFAHAHQEQGGTPHTPSGAWTPHTPSVAPSTPGVVHGPSTDLRIGHRSPTEIVEREGAASKDSKKKTLTIADRKARALRLARWAEFLRSCDKSPSSGSRIKKRRTANFSTKTSL